MQQKVEGDHRWHHKVKFARADIGKIIGSRFFSQTSEFDMTNITPMERLWYAMNQKFHKKQLWWEWRWQKLMDHILRLQNTLTERNEMIRERDDTIKQLEAMLEIQNAIKGREGGNQQ